jgi:hypothetical protein
MSTLDQLETASFATPPTGFRARQRHPLPGIPVEEIDAAVEEAGGTVEHRTIQSKGLRPGRVMASHAVATYYLIPDGAFDD